MRVVCEEVFGPVVTVQRYRGPRAGLRAHQRGAVRAALRDLHEVDPRRVRRDPEAPRGRPHRQRHLHVAHRPARLRRDQVERHRAGRAALRDPRHDRGTPGPVQPLGRDFPMIIDCHGHYTTAPKSLEGWRTSQVKALDGSTASPLRSSLVHQRRRAAREPREARSCACSASAARTSRSSRPRAMAMAHHIGTQETSLEWSRLCNDLIHRVCTLYPRNFAPRVPAAPVARRAARELRPGAGALREGAGLRRLQPEPGPVRRPLEGPAAHRPLVVPALREAGGARRPRHGARERQLQPLLPRGRRALHQRRHDGLHAVPHVGPLQGLPDAQVHHPARRRGGALPLGALPGPRAGHEAARRCGSTSWTTCSSTPASTTSRESTSS